MRCKAIGYSLTRLEKKKVEEDGLVYVPYHEDHESKPPDPPEESPFPPTPPLTIDKDDPSEEDQPASNNKTKSSEQVLRAKLSQEGEYDVAIGSKPIQEEEKSLKLNQSLLSYKPTWYDLLIQLEVQKAQDMNKTRTDRTKTEEYLQWSSFRANVEVSIFSSFHNFVWHPGKTLNTLEGPKSFSSRQVNQRITWSKGETDFPFMEPFSALTFQCPYLLGFQLKQASRRLINHGYITRLSRYKRHSNSSISQSPFNGHQIHLCRFI